MAQTYNTRLKSIASHYVKFLETKVTASTVAKDIEENAYYPSLLSLSDTFDKYKISNNAFRVNAYELDEFPVPFVAYSVVPDVGKDFILVTDISSRTVSFLYRSGRPQVVDRETFARHFQQIVWVAEPDEHSGEKEFYTKQKMEKADRARKYLLTVAALAVMVYFFAVSAPGERLQAFLVMALLKSAGLAATICLLILETDRENAFVRNICYAVGHTRCDAVLGSKAARIGGISWAEIGFFYFAAGFAWLLAPGIPFAVKIPWLAIGNAFAVPYILYSIYYQWRKIRQWCLLCLSVQAVLASELIWSAIVFWGHWQRISFAEAPAMSICVLVPVLVWYAAKPVFRRAKDYRPYLTAYKRLQYNPDIFNTLLKQQEKAPDGWQEMGIPVGAVHPVHIVLKVCNPFCGPCAKAHPQLEQLLEQNRDVQVRVLFLGKYSAGDRVSVAARHLLAIAAEGNEQRTKGALDDWYLSERKDYEAFATRYPVPSSQLEACTDQLNAMSDWCKKAGVTHTPTFFMDGYRLPENYGIEELAGILSNFIREDE